MFLRIVNRLDIDCMETMIADAIKQDNLKKTVIDRIKKATDILDESYGKERMPYDMGGYVFLVTEVQEQEEARKKIIGCYHAGQKLEYSDILCEGQGIQWHEDLYLITDDDSIMIIYPTLLIGRGMC